MSSFTTEITTPVPLAVASVVSVIELEVTLRTLAPDGMPVPNTRSPAATPFSVGSDETLDMTALFSVVLPVPLNFLISSFLVGMS